MSPPAPQPSACSHGQPPGRDEILKLRGREPMWGGGGGIELRKEYHTATMCVCVVEQVFSGSPSSQAPCCQYQHHSHTARRTYPAVLKEKSLVLSVSFQTHDWLVPNKSGSLTFLKKMTQSQCSFLMVQYWFSNGVNFCGVISWRISLTE